jgi:hypothetical protein
LFTAAAATQPRPPKFGAMGHDLADRALEIDIADGPVAAIPRHQIVDLDRIAVGLMILPMTMTMSP